ncbi:DUF192 domain-containing protein [Sinirhodobacter populi]|nr:DUF192 domain-containing protein [Sinirhodobacter populi]
MVICGLWAAAERMPAPLGALAALFVLAAGAAGAAPVCMPDQAILSAPAGREVARFHVEIADDAEERAHGLMGREHLPTASGMLFVYPDEEPVAFWMRNTLIPLDMLFIDAAGRIVSIHSEAVPLDETPIPSGAPAQFVLEINGGLARRMRLEPGMVLSHPAIDPSQAAIPCG